MAGEFDDGDLRVRRGLGEAGVAWGARRLQLEGGDDGVDGGASPGQGGAARGRRRLRRLHGHGDGGVRSSSSSARERGRGVLEGWSGVVAHWGFSRRV